MHLDACFFCTTPFQLISAISIVKEKKERADLYIISQFENAKKIANNIKKLHIFVRVKVINDSKLKSIFINNNVVKKLHLGMLLSYAYVNTIVKRILFNCTDYSRLYISSKAYVLRLVEYYFEKNNKNVEKVYFDDGIGSYSGFYNINTLRKRENCIKRLFSPRMTKLKCNNIYVYSPMIFKCSNPGNTYVVHGISNVCNSDIDTINKVFNSSNQCKIDEPIILLDTIPSEVFEKEVAKEYTRIVDSAVELLGNRNVMIKKHPRDNSTNNPQCEYYHYDSLPFEIVIANSCISNKVLISYFSTAAITPKLLFDQEPYVILLNNLVDSKTPANIEIKRVFDSVKMQYKDSARFIIPQNKDELFSVLKSIKSMLELVKDE